ncbi:MAG: hypothetical protein JKX78_14330 [Alteromonadaceae bacterium]|nr:hypothetical protein [Alteromonadaceae bacterium]
MLEIETFFDERKTELIKYAAFLRRLERRINKAQSSSEIALIMPLKDQLPVFKSQAILMTYNLIEGTINKAISQIFDKVSDANLKHNELSDHLQKIWLKYLTLNIDDGGKHKERITDINQFISSTVELELLEFRKKNKSYFGAGSLDSKRIENIFLKFSIQLTAKEFKLQEIKNDRNFLAHGEKSFTEVGQGKTVSEIVINCRKVIEYLKKLIEQIRNYIVTESFKVLP